MRSGAVAEAAEVTLSGTTARLERTMRIDPPPPAPASFRSLGTVDFIHGRTRFVTEHNAFSLLDAAAPWLFKDDERELLRTAAQEQAETLLDGSRHIVTFGGKWFALGDPDRPMDDGNPAWVVTALLEAETTDAGSPDGVRGARCRRHAFTLDRSHIPRTGSLAAILPPERYVGEAWIDDDRRLRRVTWRKLGSLRRHSPWSDDAQQSRAWTTLELWDFGVPEPIELPPLSPTPKPAEPSATRTLTFAKSAAAIGVEIARRRLTWKGREP
jgi:hypothetical protein